MGRSRTLGRVTPREATIPIRRASRLVAWVRSWRAGLAPYDDVPGSVAGDEEHVVAGLPGVATHVPLGEGITALSKVAADDIRLILPVPGDPRGLPGPGPFTRAALGTGEAVVAGALGLVPEVHAHTSGSGDTWESVVWRAYELPAPATAPEYVTCGEAELDLAQTLTAATDALARLDVARWQPELAGTLAALRRPDVVELPPGYDPRARRLFARAAMLDGVLALAEHAAPGGALTAHEAAQRSELLRPLSTACRRALVAACNSPLRP